MKPTRSTTTTVRLINNIFSNDIIGVHNRLQGILCSGIYEPLPTFILTTLNNCEQYYVAIETRKYTYHAIPLFKSTIEATIFRMMSMHVKIPKQIILNLF